MEPTFIKQWETENDGYIKLRKKKEEEKEKELVELFNYFISLFSDPSKYTKQVNSVEIIRTFIISSKTNKCDRIIKLFAEIKERILNYMTDKGFKYPSMNIDSKFDSDNNVCKYIKITITVDLRE